MTKLKSFSRSAFSSLAFGLAVALTALSPISHAQAYFTWNGTAGANANDPTNSAAWQGGSVPTFNGANSQSFWMATGSSNLNYTAAQGVTTLDYNINDVNDLSWFGWQNGDGAGGVAGIAILNVTGGTINFNGGWQNDGGSENLWIGNSGGSNASLAINGGTVNVLNGTILGRDGASGSLSVSNGSFTTGVFNSSIGIYVGANIQNTGTGTVTIDNGGQFSLTGAATEPIQFGSLTASALNTTSDFLIFTTGSTGSVTLNLSSATLGTSYFQSLITNGFVKIGASVVTDASQFAINTSNVSASTLSLAAIPEPSTLALMVGGAVGTLLVFRRRQTGKI